MTAAQPHMTTAPGDFDLDLKVAELKISGFTAFEGLVAPEKIDRVREAFMPRLDRLKARESHEIHPKERGEVRTGKGRQQFVNRYTMHVPWEPPFSDPEIYENPVVLAFLERYWGTDDFHVTCYHSNNPYPGSEYQPWHRDIHLVTPHVGLPICPHFGVKFPLVDTSEENGSFEVMPGTQYLADPDMEKTYDDVLLRGDFPPAHRLNLKKGTFWVQDPRTLHRGTPNRSDHARGELVICYSLPWFRTSTIEMAKAEYEKLSDRGRAMLSRSSIVQP